MAQAIPDIKRDDFLYRDALFVDLGETKRHPRASASDLQDLLLPKKGAGPVKDQVAHWYEAQLIHYGLPRTKDKNTAKVRLTTAIVSGALAVPASIAQMEASMKKEYVAAVRKAKAGASTTQASKASETPATKGKKRKANDSDPGPGTTISLKIGDISLEVGVPAAAGKKQKVEKADPKKKATPVLKAKAALDSKAKASNAKAAAKTTAKPKAAEKASAAKATKTNPSTTKSATSPNSSLIPSSFNDSLRPKQTARRGKPFLSSPGTRNVPRSSQYGNREQNTPSDTDMDDAPPPYESIEFGYPASPRRNRSMLQISGLYHVRLPQIQAAGSIALKVDHASGKLWGSFDFDGKRGVIRTDDLDDIAVNRSKSFGWRSTDATNGRLRFGRGCDGSIEFDGAEALKGSFFGLIPGEELEFSGWIINSHEVPDPEELRDEWDEYPRIAYGRD